MKTLIKLTSAILFTLVVLYGALLFRNSIYENINNTSSNNIISADSLVHKITFPH